MLFFKYACVVSAAEFKRALRALGARHPEAYDDFVKLLQPSDKKPTRAYVTKRNVTSTDAHELEAGGDMAPPAGVTSAPTADDGVVTVTESARSERQLWRTVERKRSVGKEEDVVHPQWGVIEKNMSESQCTAIR